MRDNIYLQKSNMIVRTYTNEYAGVITQRMFNFLIKKQRDQNWIDLNPKKPKIGFYLADFCKYYDIDKTNMFEKVKFKNEKITLIKKEIKILTQLQFYFEIKKENEIDNKFEFVNLFYKGGYDNGYVYFEVNKDLINKKNFDLRTDYTNIFLPYTKLVSSKYSLRIYEYLRSYLLFNRNIEKMTYWKNTWTMLQLGKILNLNLVSSYFKNSYDLKKRILDPVKKDLAQTDIVFDYELIKNRRKYEKIAIKAKWKEGKNE